MTLTLSLPEKAIFWEKWVQNIQGVVLRSETLHLNKAALKHT